MTLRFLLDEHLRGAPWDIIKRHNLLGVDPLDAVRVGDPADLPLGSDDREVLLWAEREERVLISQDKSTMPTHLAEHLSKGRHSPGIMIVRAGTSLPELLTFLVLAAHATEPSEWVDQLVLRSAGVTRRLPRGGPRDLAADSALTAGGRFSGA